MKWGYVVAALVFAVIVGRASICSAPAVYNSPEEQREIETRCDKLKILHSAEMRTDTSTEFITIPADYPEVKDFDVAKTPPTIDFAVIQGYEPWYLPVLYKKGNRNSGIYGGWGDVSKGPDGCFYFSIGDHRSYGGTAYIIKYDPKKKKQSIAFDLKKVIGWKPTDYADGKFHGDPEIGPNGDMWLLSYFGPQPTEEEMKTVYRGSYILKYNVFTGKVEQYGIPLEGESWPYHCYDPARGLFFGIGSIKGYVIAYDTKAKRMIFGGACPDSITWCERCVMLDKDTGKIYTTDSKIYYQPGTSYAERYRGNQHFVSYERRNNTFTRLKACVPPNPVTGTVSSCRAHTKDKDAEGAFWCMDVSGAIFKFYPEQDRTESVGINWGKEGKYTSNMNHSPKKRYVYYMPGADTQAFTYGTPVVQFDTKTGKKKVIAFLNDFYLNKYGYSPGGTYGIELDEKGETLFCYTNGQFTTKELSTGYGRPAIFHVHIPASERVE